MIAKLPKWVEYGAFVLALMAGMINAVALLGFEHQAVSHVSGTATLVGVSLVGGAPALHLLGVLLAFLVGAACAGLLVESPALKLGRHYDTALVLEALLLVAACVLLARGHLAGHWLASAACGLQNALASHFSGAVIRTTHLTGVFTDLGIMLGSWLRGAVPDKRKAWLLLLIILGFAGGAALGAVGYPKLFFLTLLLPAGGCLLLATIYRAYVHYLQRQAVED